MNRNDLIQILVMQTQLSKAEAERFLTALFECITDAMKKGDSVQLKGFGSFLSRQRSAAMGRNPRTGEAISIPAMRVPKFKAGRSLKEAVHAGGAGGTSVSRSRRGYAESAGSAEYAESAGDASETSEPAEDVVSPSVVHVPVHYATNRKKTGKKDPNKYYGSGRNKTLLYGRLLVSIPVDEHDMGQLERPSLLRLEFRENPEKHIVLREISELGKSEFFSSLASDVQQLKQKLAFVFVHGFHNTFADAARRAAQLAYDLFLVEQRKEAILDCVPILYSWPSKGTVLPYVHDTNNADASVGHLKKFLKDVAARSGADAITIIAHSMGNRTLTSALEKIGLEMQAGDGPLVNEIILAAPDIDQTVFRHAADAVMRTGKRITLYASRKDKALKASIKVNGFPRLGDSSAGVVVLKGMDSIDASAVGGDLLDHSYVGGTSVLTDLHSLILRGDSPDKRFGLLRKGQPPQQYWAIRARS